MLKSYIVQLAIVFDTIVISMFSIILSCMVKTVHSLIFHFATLRSGPCMLAVSFTGMDVKICTVVFN